MNLWWLFGIIPFGLISVWAFFIGIYFLISPNKETNEGWMAISGALVSSAVPVFMFIPFSLSDEKWNHKVYEEHKVYQLVIPSSETSGHIGLFGGYIKEELKWEVYTKDANNIYKRKWIDNYGIVKDSNVPVNEAWLVYKVDEYQYRPWYYIQNGRDVYNQVLHVNPQVVINQIDKPEGLRI